MGKKITLCIFVVLQLSEAFRDALKDKCQNDHFYVSTLLLFPSLFLFELAINKTSCLQLTKNISGGPHQGT